MDVDNIIGNGTDAFCLPTVKGKHADLKSIHRAGALDNPKIYEDPTVAVKCRTAMKALFL
jgi:hypothetical protein